MATDTKSESYSAEEYNKTASFVYSDEFISPILSLLDAKPGEQIIDFGCGSGEVTVRLKQIVGDAGAVVGFDYSESMVDRCKANGLQYLFVGDAQNLQFPDDIPAELRGNFDAVFSNAVLHWCKSNPEGVLQSAKRVLKPGGRFIIEMGGYMNCVGVRSALHTVLRSKGYDPNKLDPWFFPTAEHYKTLLEHHGFTVQSIGIYPRMTPLKGRLRDWLHLFARQYLLRDLKDDVAEDVMNAVEDMCSVDCRDESGKWSIMYTRLRVAATVG